MDINTEDLLTLVQWLSPSYPVGAYAYSHGLEHAIDTGSVTDSESLADFIEDVLEHGGGYADAVFFSAAYKAGDITRVDQECRAYASSHERLKETTLQGAAFCKITKDVWALPIADLTYPVAVGASARARDISLLPALSVYLHSFVSNLASVGMRLVPLGQSEGHQLIHDLKPLCTKIADAAAHGDIGTLQTRAFLSDIAAMNHETQYSRIYRT